MYFGPCDSLYTAFMSFGAIRNIYRSSHVFGRGPCARWAKSGQGQQANLTCTLHTTIPKSPRTQLKRYWAPDSAPVVGPKYCSIYPSCLLGPDAIKFGYLNLGACVTGSEQLEALNLNEAASHAAPIPPDGYLSAACAGLNPQRVKVYPNIMAEGPRAIAGIACSCFCQLGVHVLGVMIIRALPLWGPY